MLHIVVPSLLIFVIFPESLPNKYPSVTSTTHVADFFPSEFFTVIVAVPVAFAVTSPVSFTVATSVLLLVHCTFSVVSAGFTVAVNCAV